MSAKYQIEALLRPAVEFNTVIVGVVFIVFFYKAPELIFMTPVVANTSLVLLCVFVLYRFYQGLKIVRYKRRLRRLPYYSMANKDIPVSNQVLFIGKGFQWGQKHVQRLRDIALYGGGKFTNQTGSHRLVRSIELYFEHNKFMSWLLSPLSSNSVLNPFRPLPPVGGHTQIHAVGTYEGEKNVYLQLSERNGHTLVLGTTRVGKTRLAETLIKQDIARGDITVVFDPKGDAELMRSTYQAAQDAGRHCYVFHLGYPDTSARYNPIGTFSRITEVPTRITDRMSADGGSAAFKMFSWRYVNLIAQALIYLGDVPDYQNINKHVIMMDDLFIRYGLAFFERQKVTDYKKKLKKAKRDLVRSRLPSAIRERDEAAIAVMQIYKDEQLQDVLFDGLLSAFRTEKSYYDKLVASLMPMLEQLNTGRTAELLAPDYYDLADEREVFTWKTVIDQNAVVYVGLDCLSDAIVGGAVGASMFSDLTSTLGAIYKGSEAFKRICIHADEFSELLGDQFIPMANKGGGAGLQITAYTQTSADLTVGIGNAEKANQLVGNFNNLIVLRVKNKETAEMLTQQLPDVQVSQLTVVTSARDSSDVDSSTHFTSTNEDRITTENVPLLSAAEIVALPKGQAFLFTQGNLYKVRIPLPDNSDSLPDALESIAQSMQDKYLSSTPEDWYGDVSHTRGASYE